MQKKAALYSVNMLLLTATLRSPYGMNGLSDVSDKVHATQEL